MSNSTQKSIPWCTSVPEAQVGCIVMLLANQPPGPELICYDAFTIIKHFWKRVGLFKLLTCKWIHLSSWSWCLTILLLLITKQYCISWQRASDVRSVIERNRREGLFLSTNVSSRVITYTPPNISDIERQSTNIAFTLQPYRVHLLCQYKFKCYNSLKLRIDEHAMKYRQVCLGKVAFYGTCVRNIIVSISRQKWRCKAPCHSLNPVGPVTRYPQSA